MGVCDSLGFIELLEVAQSCAKGLFCTVAVVVIKLARIGRMSLQRATVIGKGRCKRLRRLATIRTSNTPGESRGDDVLPTNDRFDVGPHRHSATRISEESSGHALP
jgi:hypothetical protein